jgi:hypothetical protein
MNRLVHFHNARLDMNVDASRTVYHNHPERLFESCAFIFTVFIIDQGSNAASIAQASTLVFGPPSEPILTTLSLCAAELRSP